VETDAFAPSSIRQRAGGSARSSHQDPSVNSPDLRGRHRHRGSGHAFGTAHAPDWHAFGTTTGARPRSSTLATFDAPTGSLPPAGLLEGKHSLARVGHHRMAAIDHRPGVGPAGYDAVGRNAPREMVRQLRRPSSAPGGARRTSGQSTVRPTSPRTASRPSSSGRATTPVGRAGRARRSRFARAGDLVGRDSERLLCGSLVSDLVRLGVRCRRVAGRDPDNAARARETHLARHQPTARRPGSGVSSDACDRWIALPTGRWRRCSF
jgi:hypothetical protein